LWKILTIKYTDEVAVGAARDHDGSVARSYGIESADGKTNQILLWPVGADKPELYTGAFELEDTVERFDAMVEEGDRRLELRDEL